MAKSKEITDKRLQELFHARGVLTHKINQLKINLKGIDTQIEALNETAPLFTILEAELIKTSLTLAASAPKTEKA